MSKLTTNNQINKTTTYYIDATNVCYWSNPEVPSLAVLLKLLLILRKIKKQPFFCIFDANTAHKLPPDERDIYNYMLNNGNFHQVSGGKRADDYILSLADMYNGNVISNDNYSDPKYSRYRWKDRDYRPTRLFMGEVIKTTDGEHLMLFDLDINVRLDQSVSELFKELEKVLNPPKLHYNGVVKFYNNQRGWGGITFLKETDIAFTKSSDSNLSFEEGQEVEFKISETEKGLFAEDVVIKPATIKFFKGVISIYDEVRETGFISIVDGPQRLFFRKSYFDEGVDNSVIAKNMEIECVIGTNSKGECARQIRFVAPVAEVLLRQQEEKVKIAEEKIKNLQELLLLSNKKLNQQAQELIVIRKKAESELETLKKAYQEEINALKSKLKPEVQSPLPEKEIEKNVETENKQKTLKKKSSKKSVESELKLPKELDKQANEKEQQQPSKAANTINKSTKQQKAVKVQDPVPVLIIPETKTEVKTELNGKSETIVLQKKKMVVPAKQIGGKVYRLTRVASEINVEIDIVKEHLKNKNIEVESSPHAKIDEETRQLLIKDFKSVKALKEKTEHIHLRTSKNVVEKVVKEETKHHKVQVTEKKEFKISKPENYSKKMTEKDTNKPTVNPEEGTAKKNVKTGGKQPKKVELPLPEEFETEDKRLNWWSKLEPQWKKAFNVAMGNIESINKPTDADILRLVYMKTLDLDNTTKNTLTFKLTNLSGIKHLTNLTKLNVSGHELVNINGIMKLINLTDFNCSHNKLMSLNGLPYLENLERLDCSHNLLKAGNLKAIDFKIPTLRKLDCRVNQFLVADRKFLTDLRIKEVQF